MYGREELKLYWGGAECVPDDVYEKDDADKVMDAMEERIKHLESILDLDPRTNLSLVDENQQLRSRIKELENKLYGSSGISTRLLNRINNFRSTDPKATDLIDDCYKCIHQQMATISKMETTQKWISVKDRLPEEDEFVLAMRPKSINYKIDVVMWSRYYSNDITHWMPLPPPPTTEENK